VSSATVIIVDSVATPSSDRARDADRPLALDVRRKDLAVLQVRRSSGSWPIGSSTSAFVVSASGGPNTSHTSGSTAAGPSSASPTFA